MNKSIKRHGLVPKKEQQSRIVQIRERVLSFLYYEPYTTVSIIQELTDYKTPQGTSRLLRKLESDGFIKRHRLKDLAARNFSLWGITGSGCAAIYNPEMPYMRTRGFDTSKIFLTTLNHLLICQKVKCLIIKSKKRIKLKHINQNEWESKLPDILVKAKNKDTQEAIISYEIELTIKSEKRYERIIKEYQKYISQGSCDYIFWVTDDEKKLERLSSIFHGFNAGEKHKFRLLETLNF